jgi:hypothetical protein
MVIEVDGVISSLEIIRVSLVCRGIRSCGSVMSLGRWKFTMRYLGLSSRGIGISPSCGYDYEWYVYVFNSKKIPGLIYISVRELTNLEGPLTS